ncbi:hypothetical protein ACLMJK_003504 [Lecanora helva]
MDPLSVAGLAISAGGIAFQILGGCIKGFVLLSYAHGFGKDSITYHCMLNLQELQLVEWSQRAGLLQKPPCLDPRLSESVVCAVLRELQSLILDTSKLKARYKMTYTVEPVSSSELQSQSDDAKFSASLFKDAVSDDIRRDIMSRAGVIESNATWPKRVWWAAVDRNRFQELIQNIRMLTTELWRLLDPLRQDDMSKILQILLCHVIGMSESLDSVYAIQQALLQSSAGDHGQFDASALASVANLKFRSMQLSSGKQVVPDSIVDGSSLDGSADSLDREEGEVFQSEVDIESITNFAPLKNNEAMGIATYKGMSVFIEQKTLPSMSKSKLLQRAKDLAVLLSASKDPSFHSLRCCGLALNSTKTNLAFIFDLPSSLSVSQAPSPPSSHLISLRNIFSLSPSITTRVSLALKLLESLRWFHAANWLHKDLRSEHILFPVTDSKPDLTRPIIAGFAFSRADTPAAISEQPSSDWQRDLYRHPDAMGEPTTSFTKDKDIYSLATVLVEIGEWRSLKSILGSLMDTRRYDCSLIELSKVKPWLEGKGVEGLKFRIGDVYSGIVGMMLANIVPERWQEGEGVRQAGVLDTGVRELSKCVI